MRRARQTLWYKALVMWACVLLAASGVPVVPARAEAGSPSEMAAAGTATAATSAATDASSAATDAQDTREGSGAADKDTEATTEETMGTQAADEPDSEATVETSDASAETTRDEAASRDAGSYNESSAETRRERETLSSTVVTDDGRSYSVTVSYDEDAQVSEGATLYASLFVDGKALGPEGSVLDGEAFAAHAEQVLASSEDDRLLDIVLLYLWLEVNGRVVEPASEVDVTIETNAYGPAWSSCAELVLEGEGEPTAMQNLTECASGDAGQSAMTKLAFPAKHLGAVALARVVTRRESWDARGMRASLWALRRGAAVAAQEVDPPQLEEGVESLGCYVGAPAPGCADVPPLWVTVEPNEGAAERPDSSEQRGGTYGYLLDGDEGAELGEAFCGPEGTEEPVEVGAGKRLLLTWDSGYRNDTLSMQDVTVEGLMPEDTEGEVRNVTQNYEAESVLDGLDAQTASAVETGQIEVTALAAYDITLAADGAEYQPDEEHPLTVTMASGALEDALASGAEVRVWHIGDDGLVEPVEGVELLDGAVRFEATGFSTYLLTAQSDAPVTSQTFSIRAIAKTYARASKVTFVDENKNPISGTVSGTRTVSLAGSGPESNETNTIDLYEFADKLDPAIADEYDFSRVFVQLAQSNQKDFRYIQVADGTAIDANGSTTLYRAYFYMDSIEQNRPGQDYNGTWYQLSTGGRMDDVYIEFYHVGMASFYALDARGDTVEGAEFALYTDSECYTPLEYKNEEVRATSDGHGLVSFGKIPRGTYYMKETVIPEGFKKSTNIYTIVVDGETPIANVMHEDDDGSVVIADVLRMRLTKKWDDDEDKHVNDSVTVKVYARGEVVETAELNASNGWTQLLEGLDPNEAYMVSETSVKSGTVDVTNSWIPEIAYDELDSHVEYYKAEDFRKGKQYVILTKTNGGTRALTGQGSLTTKPLAADDAGVQITGNVTDEMLWSVDTITKDGVIALQNVGSGAYLDHTQSAKWHLNPNYPVPLYVRHLNDGGKIKFYHRANMNAANASYLYIWYGPSREGQVDRYWNDASQAATFDIYRKVNVCSVDVTIRNKTTRYPVKVKNVEYPTGAVLPGMTYDLHYQEGYDESNPGTPLMGSLEVGEDGYLRDSSGSEQIELIAGRYVLRQTGDLSEQGYAPLAKPVKFTITRGGALRVASQDREFPSFAYVASEQVGGDVLPVLQVPHIKPVTLEVTLQVQGKYADMTRGFEFRLAIPDGVEELHGAIDGAAMSFSEENDTFVLSHGQTLRLENVPAMDAYCVTLTEDTPYVTNAEAANELVTVNVGTDNPREVTLSDISGTEANPARVTITNTLPNDEVPATGVEDNAALWGGIVGACITLFAVIWLRERRVRRG